MATACKIPVHIEICIRNSCSRRVSEVCSLIGEWVKQKCPYFRNGSLLLDGDIATIASSVVVVDLPPGRCVSFWQAELCLHAFRLCEQGPENDFLEGEEELPAAEQWELPNSILHNLWDSIVVENTVKTRLLSYCSSSIRFSEARIDTDIISWNRMILLHGPPGTGKTTICKGLAQKTFIRNSDRFSSGMLLEVNSHSLFSKWFSESGKLVMKLFTHIAEIAEDEECMVVVLIDEVESITASRGSAARSNEPGDAVRVVNAVLTSLDALKRRPNVLVLCTSNLIASVDPAFLDRVDMKVHLGPPPVQARYDILHSCVRELAAKGIIAPAQAVAADCGAIEEQLLLRLGAGSLGKGARRDRLAALARAVAAPPLQGWGFDESDASPGWAAAGKGAHDLDAPQHGGEMYWPETPQSADLSLSQMQLPPASQASQATQGTELTEQSVAESSDLSLNIAAAHMDESPASECASGGGDGSGEGKGFGSQPLGKGATAEALKFTVEQYLYVVATLCEGMSGRALRKLPIKAHAFFLQRPTVTLMEFVGAMHGTIEAERVTGADLS